MLGIFLKTPGQFDLANQFDTSIFCRRKNGMMSGDSRRDNNAIRLPINDRLSERIRISLADKLDIRIVFGLVILAGSTIKGTQLRAAFYKCVC